MSANSTDDHSALADGDKVELTADPPDYGKFALQAGDQGVIEMIDWLGTIHVVWARTGERVGIIAEISGLLRKTGEL